MKIQIEDNELRIELIKQLTDELPVLRAKGRLTQKEVADNIGISRQTYSGIETGKHEMNWTIFLALVAYFQNNELTRKMIEGIDGFNDGLSLPGEPATMTQLGEEILFSPEETH